MCVCGYCLCAGTSSQSWLATGQRGASSARSSRAWCRCVPCHMPCEPAAAAVMHSGSWRPRLAVADTGRQLMPDRAAQLAGRQLAAAARSVVAATLALRRLQLVLGSRQALARLWPALCTASWLAAKQSWGTSAAHTHAGVPCVRACVLMQEQITHKKGKGKQQPEQQQAAGEEMMAE